MDPTLIGIMGIIVLFTLMALGMPIGFCMAIVGFCGFSLVSGAQGALGKLATVSYTSVASYSMTVLPLFMLMGEFASAGGLMFGAYKFVHSLFGRVRGGLSYATIIACGLFAAVCGSSMATASTITSIALPEMRRYKYDPAMSLACVASGGTLGILIPPSVPFVLFAIFAQESVGKLFMAGVLPGVLMIIIFIVIVYIMAIIKPDTAPSGPTTTLKQKLSEAKGTWSVLLLVIIVLGGIWGGVFTATEAGAVGALGCLLIGMVKRNITLKNFCQSLLLTSKITAMIFVILIGAMIFNYFVVVTGLASDLANLVLNLNVGWLGVLIVILFIYFILGCIMDTLAMTVLTLPIFIPILTSINIDLIWFGVLFVIMCELAMITPPFGMNVFVLCTMAPDVPMTKVFRAVLPFVAGMVVCLIIVIVFPQIALFLPTSMIGK
jgi:C4-dicarboxylate transporter, DctM subunit